MARALRSLERHVGIGLGTVLAATLALGWCYLLRAPTEHWPGPRLNEALPLDSLANHDQIPLVVFVVTLAVAGILVGALARALGFDGITIALSVGAGVGAWLYLSTAVSLFIVNQSSLVAAFDATRDLQTIYLASALFALGVALVARRTEHEQWLTRVMPGAVGLLGIAYVLSATLPSKIATGELGGMLLPPSSPITRSLEVVIGVVVILAARGLARRSRRALLMAGMLIAIVLVLRLFDGFNVIASLVSVLVLVSLAARGADFSFPGDPVSRRTGPIRALAFVLLAFAYGIIALSLNLTAVGFHVHFTKAFRSTVHALLLGAPMSTQVLPDSFADWFPWTLRLIVLVGVVWGAVTWFAPWRHRLTEDSNRRERAASLVEEFGRDSLAPFALRHDKALYFYPEGPDAGSRAMTVIAYRVVRGVAIVSGDPIGPDEQASLAVQAFRAMCAQHGWRFALLGASDRLLDTYRSQGLKRLYHGDEAVIDVPSFSLAGGAMKSVRQAVHRLERKGYTTQVAHAGALSPAERAELLELEGCWLGGAKRKGFVMELDELFRLDGEDAIFVIGRDAAGSLVGFLEIALCPASNSLSLSSMPRTADAPNGLNAALIVAATDWARVADQNALSLNFSPAARLFAPETDQRWWLQGARFALLGGKRLLGLQLDNLLRFNRQFCPRWQPRYVIVERLRYLPKILIAAMAAERYLPFADLLRGREWRESPAREVVTASP